MANTFDFDGTINGNKLTSDGSVEAAGIVKTSDTLVVVDAALEAELTAILGDISYTG